LSTRKKSNQKANPKSAQPYKIFGHDDKLKGDIVHLAEAKRFLAPFSQKTLGGPPNELSEEFAEAQIKDIAAIYNSHRTQVATAPRSNVPRDRLAELAKKADELHELISSMGDIERAMYEGADVPRELYSQAKVDWLPRSSVMPRPDSESKWLVQLAAFAELSRKLLAFYNQSVGPDVGGRTNAHNQLHNSPEYVLIQYGWKLFEKHKPGQSTSSETGAFHLFLQQIYEYATGKGADEVGAPALIPKIKQMIKPLREYERYIENVQLADKLEARFLKRLKKGASYAELKAIISELKGTIEKIDPNAASALNTATTRRRSRS
jgi:hypothetical protein